MIEIYKDIKGYENIYRVSNFGNVKRLSGQVKAGIGQRTIKERILIPTKAKGYFHVTLCKNNTKITYQIHKLVASTFLLKSQSILQVNHKDGNKLNNKVFNLEWVTAIENTQHAIRTGLFNTFLDNHPMAKLTMKQATEIREKYVPYHITRKDLAMAYSVSVSTIKDVLSFRYWNPKPIINQPINQPANA